MAGPRQYPPQEVEDWLDTDKSKSVGDSDSGESTGHESGRRTVEIQRTKKDELADHQWDHMASVIGYIKRHCRQDAPKEDVETSHWAYSLKTGATILP